MNSELPRIIQGGMGVGVSGWRLARAVSRAGQIGVVSGTAVDLVLTRRLQLGDPEGHLRRALSRFPVPGVAERILDRYFIAGGKAPGAPFRAKPVPAVHPHSLAEDLLVVSNFVEVFLAKENHGGLVGINYLEKIQLPTLASVYGAMLAGVDFVFMGAGIPKSIPGVLDGLACGAPVTLKLHVEGAPPTEEYATVFEPSAFCRGQAPQVARPRFVPIISSATLGAMLARRSNGRIDGLVVEGFEAGGHNAPPRGPLQLTSGGEPIFGDRDVADLEAIRALGLPFWVGGGYASSEGLARALQAGAAGIQVGTPFAYCEESDLAPDLKLRVLAASRDGQAVVFTDPLASPTGFPFKVVLLEDSLSAQAVYDERKRICDLGYLRQSYRTGPETLTWRCSAEPVADFMAKGGTLEETVNRKCLCNALLSNIGLGQVQSDGMVEKPLVTSGLEVAQVARFLQPGAQSYRADDVIRQILREQTSPPR